MEQRTNTLERDKQILDIVAKTYAFQFDLRDKLDNKLNNFIAITATVATLSIGLALFVFDKIPLSNLYFWHLVTSFGIYLGFFVLAMVVGLTGYKPTAITWYPGDPEQLIQDYCNLQNEMEVVHIVAASFAEAANKNMERNARKSKMCNYVFWMFILGILTIVVFAAFMIVALGAMPTANLSL
jgi:hypothetical protein